MKFLKQTLAIFSAIFAIFTLGFFKGKNNKENADNKESAEQIKKFNRIKRDITRLSDADIDSKLQRWRKVRNLK